jgi:hypothetical protein
MNALIALLVQIIEVLFIAGVLGSAVVWLLTTFEDVENMFTRDDSSGGGAISEERESHS